MNKETIITLLLALVTVAGQGQVHYRIEGNIDMPKFTGVMEINVHNVPVPMCIQKRTDYN